MSKIFDALTFGRGEASEITKRIADGQPLGPKVVLPVAGDTVSDAVDPDPGPAVPFQTATVSFPSPSRLAVAAEPEPEARRENGVRVLPVQPANATVFPFNDDNSRASEQYRMVRTKIIQHPDQPRLLAISSAGSGDGKTITAMNLAAALALKEGVNVLLVEGDMRRSNIARMLGLPVGPGLAEVLAGEINLSDAIVRVEQLPNLYVLVAGDRRSSPVELLDTPVWRELAVSFRKQFRFTIFDSPPMGSVADYDLIQEVSDRIIMVLRPDFTKRTAFQNALRSIPKGKLLGVLLNSVTDWFLSSNSDYYSDYYDDPKK